MPTQDVQPLHREIFRWRARCRMVREMKWTKVSACKLEQYKAFVNHFFDFAHLRFNCMVIDTQLVDYGKFCGGDHELGFYKFYFQLLSRRCHANRRYMVFTDQRPSNHPHPLRTLHRCVNHWCLGKGFGHEPVRDIQPVDSRKEDIMQLADVILGAVGYRCNGGNTSAAKLALCDHIETRMGRSLHLPTPRNFTVCNLWHWKPKAVHRA